MKKNTTIRYSDQVEYYLNHLKKQNKAKKNKYSILGRHHNSMDSFIRNEINKLPKNKHVLDAGCGLSAWTNSSLRKRYRISGVDGEPDAIEACNLLYKDDDYKVGNLYELNSKNEVYDAVVMREVIEHFITSEKAVKEVHRILKPGGIYILTTPNYDSRLTSLIENTYNRFFGGPCKPYRDDVHPSKFKPDTLKKLLRKYFDVERLETIDYGITITCVARKKEKQKILPKN